MRWLRWWLGYWWLYGVPPKGAGPEPARGRRRRYGTDGRGRTVRLACRRRGRVTFSSAAGWAGIQSSATLDDAQARALATQLGVRRARLRRELRRRRPEVLAAGGEHWLRDQGFEPDTSAYIESRDMDLSG